MTVFVDTSAWIALFHSLDKFHKKAVSFTSNQPQLVTSNIVVHETLAMVEKRVSFTLSSKIGTFLFDSPVVSIWYISKEEEQKTWKLYKQQPRSQFSLVDCSIKILMDAYGVRDIFTFDTDFKIFGLNAIP